MLEVWFYDTEGVRDGSIGDGDLWVTSAKGFFGQPTFDQILPLRRIGTTAQYALAAPDGGWGADGTTEYAVMLAGREVITGGGAFPLQFLGSFSVAPDDGDPSGREVFARQGGVRVEASSTPGTPGGEVQAQVVATLKATFSHPVDVIWGEPVLGEDGSYTVQVSGLAGEIVQQVLTSYETEVDLGVLGEGKYTVHLESGGRRLATGSVSVGDIEDPDLLVRGQPIKVDIQIEPLRVAEIVEPVEFDRNRLGRSGYVARVQLTYGGYVARQNWERVTAEGNELTSDVSVFIDPRILILTPQVIERRVFLGSLEPGDYTYTLTSFGEVLGSEEFTLDDVGEMDLLPPSLHVERAVILEPTEEPIQVVVRFSDESGLVREGIEEQTLSALGRLGEVYALTRTDLTFSEDEPSTSAMATYEFAPIGGAWDVEDNGVYRLRLSAPERVCDTLGNHLGSGSIGSVSVQIPRDRPDPDPKPDPETPYPVEMSFGINEEGKRELNVSLFVPEALAVRDDWEVEWGEPLLRALTFYVRPQFVAAGGGELGEIEDSETTGAGMFVSHTYEIGENVIGLWRAVLRSNLGHFGQISIQDQIRPLPELPEFASWQEHVTTMRGDQELSSLWDYLTGIDPLSPRERRESSPKPLMIEDEEGAMHFGLQCRRAAEAVDARMKFYGSTDLSEWVELGPEEIEEVSSEITADGIEIFIVCLTEGAATSEIRFIRAEAERW